MENPTTALIILLFIGVLAFIGNHGYRETVKEQTKKEIEKDHILVERDIFKKSEKWVPLPEPHYTVNEIGKKPF